MIDTIVIRVHDLPKHKELVRLVIHNFKGYSKETALIPQKPYDDLTNETSYPEEYCNASSHRLRASP